MKTQQITFLIPPDGAATLTLPERLTPDAFDRLEMAINDVLGGPRNFCEPGATDRGSIEFDSWLVHLN